MMMMEASTRVSVLDSGDDDHTIESHSNHVFFLIVCNCKHGTVLWVVGKRFLVKHVVDVMLPFPVTDPTLGCCGP
jgi:hypothetical protein